MLNVKQITPVDIYNNRDNLNNYFQEQLSHLVTGRVWMSSLKDILQRFRLQKIVEMSHEEMLSYQWDTSRVDSIIRETFKEVKTHLPYDKVSITVFPSLPFPWLLKHDRSIWTHGFTNGPNSIQLEVPPEPDEEFLKYMVAHELHHATPINPIYQLSLDNFPLYDWFKMEGGAELFALSLYEDKRWWRDDFSPKVEDFYWEKVRSHLNTVDDVVKSRYCFGDLKNGIPYMAGYAFAYKVFLQFSKQNPRISFREMLEVDSHEIIQAYKI